MDTKNVLIGNIKGSTGDKGDTGLTGAQGPKGATGATGPQGLQGPIGLTGPQGLKGATGATGPQGPIGLTGPQGPVGEKGATGSQGTKGDPGPTVFKIDTAVQSVITAKTTRVSSAQKVKVQLMDSNNRVIIVETSIDNVRYLKKDGTDSIGCKTLIDLMIKLISNTSFYDVNPKPMLDELKNYVDIT